MKRTIILFTVLTLSFASCHLEKDEDTIKMTFESYKSAVKNNKDSIFFYIDSESKNALVEFENLIKFGNSKEKSDFILKSDAPLTWNYLFIVISHIGSKSYNYDSLNLNYTIKLFSLAGINIFQTERIDDFDFEEIIEINEDLATVKISIQNHFIANNKNASIMKKFPFRKENNMWKVNVISYFTLYDKVLFYQANDMNMTPEEYLLHIYSSMK